MVGLRWLVVLPFDRGVQPPDHSTSPSPLPWTRVDLGDGLDALGNRPVWAWAFPHLHDEQPMERHALILRLTDAGCWPVRFEVVSAAPTAQPLLTLGVERMLDLRLIQSAFGTNALEVRLECREDELERIGPAIRSERLASGARAVMNSADKDKVLTLPRWGRRLLGELAIVPRASERDRGNVYYELHRDQPRASASVSETVSAIVAVRSDHAVTATCSPWGLEVDAVAAGGHPDLDNRRQRLSHVHVLVRLQHQRLLDLSEVISNAPEDAPDAEQLRLLHEARRSYLQLLGSGLFSYVNRVPLVQDVYDRLREQIRLDGTHEEVRLEIDLLSREIASRLQRHATRDEQRFRDLVKVSGAGVAAATLGAALLDLVATAYRPAGWSSPGLALTVGVVFAVVTAWFIRRRRRRSGNDGAVSLLDDAT
jgi:hypothetical protein